MICPRCGSENLLYWSQSSHGSYGNACLKCKLFVQVFDGKTYSRPLDEAFFPLAYRGIPKYRDAVGWKGP